MTYVIGKECVDVTHKDCVQECPADCIYEGARALYINPYECVDCGACKLICEVGAIYYETDLPEDELVHLADNSAFFDQTLPGRDAPLGSPGGADTVGRGRRRHPVRRFAAGAGLSGAAKQRAVRT